MREDTFKKTVNLAIVLLPLFQCYNFFGISAGKILMLLFFLFLLFFGKRKRIVSKFEAFYLDTLTILDELEEIDEKTSRSLKQKLSRLEVYANRVTTLPPKGRELPESYSQELFLLLRRWAS